MFGIGGGELAALVVLAILLTPPEKIPEMSRKAARVVWFVRNIANNATVQLRQELGPEYADLQISDLHPKTFIQKHLLDDIQSEVENIKAEVDDIKADLTLEANAASDLVHGVGESVRATSSTGSTAASVVAELGVPFDPEAT